MHVFKKKREKKTSRYIDLINTTIVKDFFI